MKNLRNYAGGVSAAGGYAGMGESELKEELKRAAAAARASGELDIERLKESARALSSALTSEQAARLDALIQSLGEER